MTPDPQPLDDDPRALDDALAARAMAGDGEALGALFDRHAAYVGRFVQRQTGADGATVEDLVQDVFLSVLRAFDDGNYRPGGPVPFRGWLTRIADNASKDHRRRLTVRTRLEQPVDDEAEPDELELPAPYMPDPHTAQILDALIDRLPPHARRVMRCRRRNPGLTEAEIAERLEMSVEAYRKSIRRAFARLRELEGPRKEQLLDATHPWQNRGAPEGDETAGEGAPVLGPAQLARIRAALLDAHAALRRGA